MASEQVSWCSHDAADQASGVAEETSDSVFPFLHAQAAQLLQEASEHERDGTHQRTVEEVRCSFRTQEGDKQLLLVNCVFTFFHLVTYLFPFINHSVL